MKKTILSILASATPILTFAHGEGSEANAFHHLFHDLSHQAGDVAVVLVVSSIVIAATVVAVKSFKKKAEQD